MRGPILRGVIMPAFRPIQYFPKSSGLLLVLCSALVAGCAQGGVGTVPGVAANGGSASGTAYRPQTSLGRKHRSIPNCPTIYNFAGDPDGSVPEAGLFDLKGTLYGTTPTGGTSGLGTVYSISGGSESVLYSFKGTPDGSSPYAGLVSVDGALYGTTIPRGGAQRRSGLQDHSNRQAQHRLQFC